MTQLPSWSDGLYFIFLVFLLFVFLNLSFLGELITHFFANVGTFSGFYFYFFLYLILGYLVTTKIGFFTLKSKKEKVYWVIEIRTYFLCEDNNNNMEPRTFFPSEWYFVFF